MKKNRLYLSYIFIVTFVFCVIKDLTAQTKLIEKIEKKGDEIIVPYEKYQLANGLTLLIHEDHSDPMVHVEVTYHVGDARESRGKAGFAHFFEHMMFMTSDHLGDGELIKTITESGGEFNGSTSYDRTNYFETMPSNQLEVALWMEADRMGFMHDAVSQEKYNIQRATVKNEYEQSVTNRPYGRVSEVEGGALFPPGHAHRPAVDWMADIDKTTIKDLRQFFLRWYGPNNAVVAVAGDVNPQEVVKLTEKYFGPINRGPEVPSPTKAPFSLDKNRYVSYEDNIRFPLVRITFPGVPAYDPDEPAMEALAAILGNGNNSLMYKTFVKTQKAVRANVRNASYETVGSLTISVTTFPMKPLADIEQQIHETLKEFEKNGVSENDLQRFKSSYEADLINSLASIRGKASMLSGYQTFTGNPNYLKEEMKKYMALKIEDIMRVYNKYIKEKSAVILSVYPKGQSNLVAKPDNFTPVMNDSAKVMDNDSYINLKYQKPIDTFDRSKKPDPGPNPIVKLPDYWQEKFDNGLKVIGTKNTEIPTVTLQLSIEAGHRVESMSQAGIAKFMASLLDETTQKYTSEAISEELEKLGSTITISSGDKYITATVFSLLKNLDATLALFEEKLFQPKFTEDDFNRLKAQQLEEIANQVTQPTVIADNVYAKQLYGKDHILSVPSTGTKASVENINLPDIKKYYDTYFAPSVSNLVVVGDIDQQTIIAKLGFLRNWKNKEVKLPAQPIFPAINKTKIYLVDKESAPQSQIRIGYIALPYDATGDFYKLRLANFVLGGSFTSRINQNLRETKGYTYGARSSFNGNDWTGPFTAASGVRANVTDSAVYELMKELNNFREKGMTPKELNFMRSSVGQADALNFETAREKASFIRQVLEYNLDKNFVDKQAEILKTISKEVIDTLAKKHLPTDQMAIVVVGDKKSVKEPLSRLGYEVIELDADGNLLN